MRKLAKRPAAEPLGSALARVPGPSEAVCVLLALLKWRFAAERRESTNPAPQANLGSRSLLLEGITLLDR
jgi:hypothetical protein